MSNADVIRDQIEQVEADLSDLDVEVGAGNLSPDIAAELRMTYRTERHRLREELATAQQQPDAGPDRRRMMWGAGLTLGALAAITVFMLMVVDDREPGELATGGITSDVASGGLDLDAVTNEEMEAVIADNPNVAGMRAALARRYFEAGEFSNALGHYLVVLEQDPGHAEALATVGWMSFLSQEPELAESYVGRALEVAPGYPDALWYVANIRLFGTGDAEGAGVALQELLEIEGLPDDLRIEAESLLEQARSG